MAEIKKRMEEAVLYRASRLEEQVEKFKKVSEKVADESSKMLDEIPGEGEADTMPLAAKLNIVSTAAAASKAAYSILEKATGMDKKEAAGLNVNVTTVTSFEFPDDNPLAQTVEVSAQRVEQKAPEGSPEGDKPQQEDK